MKRVLLSGLAGALFGAGLVVSELSNPFKVLNFLDIAGTWDASLLIVMAVAAGLTAVGYRAALRRRAPLCDAKFELPSRTVIDRDLVLGAVLFGLGWGLSGYCPGPALTALVINPVEALPFLAAMLAGGWLQRA